MIKVYCVVVFVFFVLRHWAVSQVLTPRMNLNCPSIFLQHVCVCCELNDCRVIYSLVSFDSLRQGPCLPSLRSCRDLVRECFCFGCEAVNASGEAVRGLVKSRVFPSRVARKNVGSATKYRSLAHEFRQLRRLMFTPSARTALHTTW